MRDWKLFLVILVTLCGCLQAAMPSDCRQVVLGLSDGWNSSHVTLSVLEKNSRNQWVRVMGPIKGRLGRNGLVWGLGIHPTPRDAVIKQEGDGRSPAGIFRLGGLWVTTTTPVRHDRRIPLVQVGPADLWVSDQRTPHLYNRWVRLDHPAQTAWEKREQMRQRDYAHSIKLLICHNTAETKGRPIVGAGSSIFFHIWRNNGTSPTAGCTSMAETSLRAVIERLNPSLHPVYILLPRQEYMRLRSDWRLP